MQIAGPILCALLSVYDGDTISVECEIWPKFTVTASVRIRGIDTPEIRAKCPEEKRRAIAARDYLSLIIRDRVEIRDVQLGKFAGRVVADVFIEGVSVAEILIARDLGRPYSGGKREGWCDG